MTTDRKAKFFALIARANRIGALLPTNIEDIDVDDPVVIAELRVILAEFNAALAAIAAFPPGAA
ncbi:hypothetical protein [Bradyrhizobium liaoningense]|uniref:hypothetical protein n=1 Tax=Bradyrhizobium liaoningense TaxID=43992 RepID=UPI001BAB72A0|nr:hypothetical protein [Bradyrhizobium liaoningense]MBR0714055.1 hypothetical protein [Bradyrhizobium liaoningense]